MPLVFVTTLLPLLSLRVQEPELVTVSMRLLILTAVPFWIAEVMETAMVSLVGVLPLSD